MFLTLFPAMLASGGTEALAEKLTSLLGGLPPIAVVFIISMIPILELRGGLIAASLLNIPMWQAIGACVLGNILPIPIILLFVEKVLDWMEQCPVGWISKFALWLKARGTGKKAEKIRKFEFLGLILFVGIPLPGTGGWTGSLIAALLHVSRKKSVPAIFIGLIMATVIMCLLFYGGLQAIINLF
ncbi:MAG: small multi-drug export protein [Oscillospiraceae bacterium]|nr:small multi-drug export protein [Oscillospiraceae bacterium]